MPLKITQDESGNIISVENLPERDFPLPQPKPGTGRKTENKRSKQPQRRETDTPYRRSLREESTRSSVEFITCSVCNTSIPKGRMAEHLREAHLQETIESRKKVIKDIDRDLKNLVPGFHRKKIEELRRLQDILLKDLEGLQRIAKERIDTNT